MIGKSGVSGFGQLLKEQLQDPLRIRFVLCAVILAGWYFGHHAPTSDHIQHTLGRIESEKKRLATAQQVEKLRKTLAPFQERIPRKEGQNELIHFFMSHIRRTPLKLVDLSPERNDDMGTLRVIGLSLQLEGAYADLDEFLEWVENQKRLLRIDSLRVLRKAQHNGVLNIQIDLVGLVDSPKPAVLGKAAKKQDVKARDDTK